MLSLITIQHLPIITTFTTYVYIREVDRLHPRTRVDIYGKMQESLIRDYCQGLV